MPMPHCVKMKANVTIAEISFKVVFFMFASEFYLLSRLVKFVPSAQLSRLVARDLNRYKPPLVAMLPL